MEGDEVLGRVRGYPQRIGVAGMGVVGCETMREWVRNVKGNEWQKLSEENKREANKVEYIW